MPNDPRVKFKTKKKIYDTSHNIFYFGGEGSGGSGGGILSIFEEGTVPRPPGGGEPPPPITIPTYRFSRVEASKTAGMYPQQGYARNQPLGLAFDPQHPLNLPIMPIAGYYDLTQKNILGNLS